jgi:hypothetical protein
MKSRRLLLYILNLLFVTALAVGIVLIFMPQSLADIDRTDGGEILSSDLLEEANRAILSGRPFKCSEKALNDHLRLAVDVREASGFEIFSEFKRLLVRLNDDSLEIVFERAVLGFTTTVSAELTIKMFTEGSGKMTEVKVIGGKFGSLPVSKNFVGLIRKELENVAKVLVPEKEVLSCLGGINVRDGWLILKPHI